MSDPARGKSRFVIVMSQLILNNENLNKINEINCPHLSAQDNRVREPEVESVEEVPVLVEDMLRSIGV